MPLGKEQNGTFTRSWKDKRTRVTLIAARIIVCLITLAAPLTSIAEPLDYSPRWSLGFEGTLSKIEGRMGFERQSAGYGTLNDLKNDLGLPDDNQTWKIMAQVRPLEHHVFRVFGSIPELYKGGNTLNKDLRLTRLPNPFNQTGGTDMAVTFPIGHWVKSEMRYAMFGVGYDLDFLVSRGWNAGLNGEFRYLDYKVRMSTAAATNGGEIDPGVTNNLRTLPNVEETINLDEAFACMGAHGQAMFPLGPGAGVAFGGFTRMNYGVTPNYLNYVDLTMGVLIRTGLNGGLGLQAKVGYEHESIFHDGQVREGRVIELKRNGILFSLDGTF